MTWLLRRDRLLHPTRYWRVADFWLLHPTEYWRLADFVILWHVFEMFFLKIFYGTNMIYLDSTILLIFLKKCDFLKLTMQGFKSDKNYFLNKYLFSYWALAHSVFKINFSARFVCEISGNGWRGYKLRFLCAGWGVSYGMLSNDWVCKPWFETGIWCMHDNVCCLHLLL